MIYICCRALQWCEVWTDSGYFILMSCKFITSYPLYETMHTIHKSLFQWLITFKNKFNLWILQLCYASYVALKTMQILLKLCAKCLIAFFFISHIKTNIHHRLEWNPFLYSISKYIALNNSIHWVNGLLIIH